MKSKLFYSLMLSLCLIGTATASGEALNEMACDADPLAECRAGLSCKDFLEDSPTCETCQQDNCFSRRVEKSLGLQTKLTNAFLFPSELMPIQLKFAILAETIEDSSDEEGQNESLTDTDEEEENIDKEVEVLFQQRCEEMQKQVNYQLLKTFIFDPADLTNIRQAELLHKLGWVSEEEGVSAHKSDLVIAGNGVGSLGFLPKPMLGMICSYLDNQSLGAFARAEKCTMAAAEPHLYGRLVPIHNRVIWHYHPTHLAGRAGVTPFLNHLEYMTFAMKAYGYGDGEEVKDLVESPMQLLNEYMKTHSDMGKIGAGNLFLSLAAHGLLDPAVKELIKSGDVEVIEQLNQDMSHEMMLMQSNADWEYARKDLKKVRHFNEPGDLDDSSSEKEGCVIF